jgi:outer membrane protein TolC
VRYLTRFLFLSFSVLSVVSVLITLPGCRNFGTGGTGELVIRERVLREIDSVALEDFAVAPPPLATQPSTQALTQPSTRPTPPEERQIRVEDVRQLALRNNLELRVELINPSIAKEGLTEEQARFEALFTSNVNFRKNDAATFTRLDPSQSESLSASAGVTVPLQTGGTLRLDVPMNRFKTDNEFALVNPSYSSDFVASLSQPLLRGAGFDVNANPIRLAFYDLQATEARTKLEITRVLAEADRVYWRLYAAREELKVRKQEYDLAVAQLERARRQVRAAQVAEVEIIRAESGVADTLEAIINAENAVRDRQRDLKRVINEEGLGMETDTVLVPTTEPGALYFKLPPDRLAEIALERRMEMLQLELQIAAASANVEVAHNGTLPLLALDYQYSINGLGASFAQSFAQVDDADFQDHSVGLRLEVPLGNAAARARLRRAILDRVQRLTTREQQALQIRQEVYNAADQLEANWQRIVAARQRTVLAAEIRQFDQGLRTSTEVLDAQTKLANARSAEIAAVADYQISQINVAFATGTLLGANNVVWTPTPPPKE